MLRYVVLLVALLCGACGDGCQKSGGVAGGDGGSDAGLGPLPGEGPLATLPPLSARPRANDFTGAGRWLNVARPLAPPDLAGHVVVVHFWASSCVACVESLAMIAEVERLYGKYGVGVVGVHTAKLDTESEPERLRAALAQNGVTHPVVTDAQGTVAARWKAESRPALFVVDARGAIAWQTAGVPKPGELVGVVRAALSEAIQARVLKPGPLPDLKVEEVATGSLAFPGKLTALEGGGFAVSDTGHHRVVLVDATPAVKSVAGRGEPGFTDGPFAEASFRRPEGLAQIGDVLYVADTGNHAIRALDLTARTVKTVAGTGEVGAGPASDRSDARTAALRSPWDLVAVGTILYVALAGSDHVAIFDPKDGTIALASGAAFAQPMGLASDGKTVWVTNAATGSIRAIDASTRKVTTVLGQEAAVFGDVDGPAAKVRLEYPQGVVHVASSAKDKAPAIYFCDTFNSKVKRLDPGTGSTRTIVGGRGHRDLFEPTGIAQVNGELLVADTKHHRIVRVLPRGRDDSETVIEPVAIRGLVAPPRRLGSGDAADASAPPGVIAVRNAPVPRTGTRVKLVWELPAGTVLDEGTLVKLEWDPAQFDGMDRIRDLAMVGGAVKKDLPFTINPHRGAKSLHASGVLELRVCDVKPKPTCVPVRRPIEVALDVVADDMVYDAPSMEIVVVLPAAA